ncbi:MAG: hypothetical protein GC152_05980 [Alphaproteobacteria bacterium]|nr:hypothetical protein [Alphaproteobacteria bacterium]
MRRRLMHRLLPGGAAFGADRRGSTAVEFAILGPIFLMFVLSTFEVGWFYFANSQVDAAALAAAREIRTGSVQKDNLDKDEFFAAVCPALALFGDCDDKVTVAVERYGSFSALADDNDPVICRDDASTDVDNLPFEPGSDGDIVRLRICLLYDTTNPALGVNVSNASNGRRRLHSEFIFRNEPFSRSSGVGD